MYLHQKLKYNYNHITEPQEFEEMIQEFEQSDRVLFFDTESTGLHIITAVPFLLSLGFSNRLYTFDIKETSIKIFERMLGVAKRAIAHNAKFDYHMMTNVKCKFPETVELFDTIALARLTSYSDEQESLSLEALGNKYVDVESKFAGKVIKKLITDSNRNRKKAITDHLKTLKGVKPKEVWELYDNRVQYLDTIYSPALQYVVDNYKETNYLDIYLDNPELMRCYAADDVVIMREYYNIAYPIYERLEPLQATLTRECKLIRVVANMERIGFKIDINYMLESRKLLTSYRDEMQEELYKVSGEQFSVGQHAYIKKLFKIKHNMELENTDVKTLKGIASKKLGESSIIAGLIAKLRNVDKWLSTYIDGKLNLIVDGRLYSNINNSGAVSGRVSSDMQQMPKEPVLDSLGFELFHPRRMIVCDEDYYMVYMD